jgi:hypothetical protein
MILLYPARIAHSGQQEKNSGSPAVLFLGVEAKDEA